jgi:tripartite-type tricarboxylate transporter receptor subunit TctC
MNRVSRRSLLAGLMTFPILPALRRPSHADASYPTRPVKVIVPFSPGGVTDTVARLWAQHVSERLGQQFMVENQGGAGGNIGTAAASRAQPDGYTLLIAASAFAINPSLYKKIPYDPNGFEATTMLGVTPNVLVVNPSFPAKTLQEFVKAIQDKQSHYSFANSGVGTPQFLQGELLKSRFKLQVTPVPFKGGTEAIQAVVAGHVPIALGTLTGLPQLVNAGQLRALAITGQTRSPLLPDVPTFSESGAADFNLGTWASLFAPKGMPAPLVAKIYDATRSFLGSPATAERLRKIGVEPAQLTTAQFTAQLAQEMDEWARLIELADIKLD